jgi:hypothetical protein
VTTSLKGINRELEPLPIDTQCESEPAMRILSLLIVRWAGVAIKTTSTSFPARICDTIFDDIPINSISGRSTTQQWEVVALAVTGIGNNFWHVGQLRWWAVQVLKGRSSM